jgi:outer membrane protein TolC
MKRVKIERELEIQVIEAFMAVASAQSLLKDTKPQLNKNELALKDISKMREQQHLNEFDLLDYKSEFLDTKKSFDEYERSYSNMCLRLTTLMGLDPSKNITLDTSLYKQKEFNEFHFPFEIPDREDIEKTALKNRAEIYESEINQYISEIESDREFLKLFPGMSLIGSYNSSSNEFLVNDDWFSASLRITTDLFRLPSKFKKYENSKLNITIQKYKKLMTSFSVTSQVRIAYENVLEVKKRLNHQEKKYKLSLDLHKLTLSAVNSGKLNKLSTIKTEIDSILSNTHRVATLSNYFVAYYRLLNTAGVPYLSPSRLSKIQPNKLTLISDKDKKAKGTFFQKLMKEEGTIEIP